MQYANEQSRDVLNEYYEFALKFKYNDDPSIRSMIDLVYDTIDSPFGMQFKNLILDYGAEDLSDLSTGIPNNSVSSLYESNRTAYRMALDKALADFAKVN